MTKSASAFLLAEALISQGACAREARHVFDIPAGPADRSLSVVAQTAHVSIGGPNGLPQFRAAALRGSMTVSHALRQLLDGSGWRARQIRDTVYRVEYAPPARPPVPTHPVSEPKARPSPSPVAQVPVEDIIVTGQKRRQPLQDVSMSMTVIPLADGARGGLSLGARDLAMSSEGLALTNLGPGRNRQFIRGVADSPFNGSSQSTVAVQLDETRLTYDAPDPDLRLIDMERVEILKGPQGPLYGSGALGGIYHMVSRKPDMETASGAARLSGEAVEHGGPGAAGEIVLNLPLETERLALRGVGYVQRSGGWIDNAGRSHNANRTKTDGARLALRWQPQADWTIDLGGLFQDMNSKDSQYVVASEDSTRRNARIPEPSDNDFKSLAATLTGRLGTLRLLATTSYVDHGVDFTLDSTDASSQFGLSGTSKFVDDRKYSILNHEIRISPEGSSHWLAGLSYLGARSHSTGTVSSASQSVITEQLDRKITEFAAFGEVTVSLARQVTATAGARLFRSIAEDETLERSASSSDKVSKTFVSPSFSLAWTPGGTNIVYLRYARALRPGGLAPSGQTAIRRFDADELGTLDLGARLAPSRATALSASVFYTVWNDIQSDYLLPNGLVSTRNAGKACIYGIEASAEWRPFAGFQLSAGAAYTHAALVSTADGTELDDRRLPITPDVTGRLGAQYDFALGDWATTVSGQLNYVGKARLTFDESLDRAMEHYAVAAAAASLKRDRLTIGARIDNLFDIKGDSFAFGNPFSIGEADQFTPLRPRTFTISIARNW